MCVTLFMLILPELCFLCILVSMSGQLLWLLGYGRTVTLGLPHRMRPFSMSYCYPHITCLSSYIYSAKSILSCIFRQVSKLQRSLQYLVLDECNVLLVKVANVECGFWVVALLQCIALPAVLFLCCRDPLLCCIPCKLVFVPV